MRIIKYSRDVVLPKADYVFERVSDFKKIASYIRPKVEGEWLIILLKFNYKQVEEILSMDVDECANLHFYVAEDVRDNLSLKYQSAIVKDKSNFEIYLEYMDTIDVVKDDKLIREIYTRNKGNMAEIKICVDRLLVICKETSVATLKDLDKIIEKDTTVYAKDVVYAYLLSSNTEVPKSGSRLSKYKYMNGPELKNKLLENISERVAFYACRKVIKNLYDEKVNYLNAKECKELEVCKVLDYYTIAHAWLTFQLSKPAHFEICLMELGRRQCNDSIFIKTILSSYT